MIQIDQGAELASRLDAERVAIDPGRTERAGTARSVFESPRHDYSRARSARYTAGRDRPVMIATSVTDMPA